VTFIRSNIEPTEIKNGFIFFDVDHLDAFEQKELVIEMEVVKEVPVGTHLVLSSILTYRGQDNLDYAATSYSVLNVTGQVVVDQPNFLAALLGPLSAFANWLWLTFLVLLVLAAFLIYRYQKNRAKLLKSLEGDTKNDDISKSITSEEIKTDQSPPYNLPGLPVSKPSMPLRYHGNGNR
jgi:hypothetical protein